MFIVTNKNIKEVFDNSHNKLERNRIDFLLVDNKVFKRGAIRTYDNIKIARI